ncbi:hypothetical protein N7453_003301 [Penicillium expansum]|nr:hypothetical protein N7453_003301 [Penicillium expansum]
MARRCSGISQAGREVGRAVRGVTVARMKHRPPWTSVSNPDKSLPSNPAEYWLPVPGTVQQGGTDDHVPKGQMGRDDR